MDNIILVIKGKVVDEKGKGLPNLRVETWDKDRIIDELIGEAKTGRGGKFTIEFDEERFKNLFLDCSLGSN